MNRERQGIDDFSLVKTPRAAWGALLGLVLFNSCATLPEPEYKSYPFPSGQVFIEDQPAWKFQVLGPVRVRVNFSTLNAEKDEQELCRNYFNKGAADLLKKAKKEWKADAVVEVRSVVYFLDGKSKRYSTPECADEGSEGQILLEGKAVKYLPPPKAVKAE